MSDFTTDDLVECVKSCRIGTSKACGDEHENEEIREASLEALSWLRSFRPESSSEIVTHTVEEGGCFFQFEEYQRILGVIDVNGVKAKEAEQQDTDNVWDCLKCYDLYPCPESPDKPDCEEPIFSLNEKPNTLNFQDDLEAGDVIRLCVLPCFDADACLPKQYGPGGDFYNLLKWMATAIYLCSVDSDAETMAVANQYYKKVYDFIILKFQIDHSLLEEELKFMRQTSG